MILLQLETAVAYIPLSLGQQRQKGCAWLHDRLKTPVYFHRGGLLRTFTN